MVRILPGELSGIPCVVIMTNSKQKEVVMPLSRQRKRALDQQCLEFNQWATRVLEIVDAKYPKAQVTTKNLMLFWVSGVYYRTVAKHFIMKYHAKYGH
jgi:hypothetical protein